MNFRIIALEENWNVNVMVGFKLIGIQSILEPFALKVPATSSTVISSTYALDPLKIMHAHSMFGLLSKLKMRLPGGVS